MIKFYENSNTIKHGFNLAETLITLGIIGVIAAYVIPALNNEIQEKQFKEAAKAAFSKTSQAVQQMRQDEGGTLAGYIGKDGTFKPVFTNYFKVLKDCGWGNCVASSYSSTQYKTLTNSPADTSIGAEGQFVTTDGVFYNIQNSSVTAFGIIIIVDVNGYTKAPNVYGKDTFVFQIINDNLLPMGAKGTYYKPSTTFCNKTIDYSAQGFGCMDFVMQGINY